MYARVAAFEQPNVSMAADLISTVRERSESARTELPDAQALLMLIDRENARSLGITFFESEDAIRQVEPAFERMGDEIPEEMRGRRISVDVYEVVRQEGGEGARAARVSSFEVRLTKSMRASAELRTMSSRELGRCPAGRAITGSPTGRVVTRS